MQKDFPPPGSAAETSQNPRQEGGPPGQRQPGQCQRQPAAVRGAGAGVGVGDAAMKRLADARSQGSTFLEPTH